MGPRQQKNYDDICEIKESLAAVHSKLEEIFECRKDINKLLEKIETVSRENREKDEKIKQLESRIEDLEQHSRINDIIITGLKTNHKSYSRVVKSKDENDNQDAPDYERESLEQQVVEFIGDKMGIVLGEADIEACHTLKGKKSTPDIIMKVTNRKTKIKLLQNAYRLKGSSTYINEHLTRKNAGLARYARDLSKQRRIMKTWTRNCKVFVKLKEGETKMIKEMEDFRAVNLTY